MSWSEFIGNVGFPIAFCIYNVVVLNKSLKNNTRAVVEMAEVARTCKKN